MLLKHNSTTPTVGLESLPQYKITGNLTSALACIRQTIKSLSGHKPGTLLDTVNQYK